MKRIHVAGLLALMLALTLTSNASAESKKDIVDTAVAPETLRLSPLR